VLCGSGSRSTLDGAKEKWDEASIVSSTALPSNFYHHDTLPKECYEDDILSHQDLTRS